MARAVGHDGGKEEAEVDGDDTITGSVVFKIGIIILLGTISMYNDGSLLPALIHFLSSFSSFAIEIVEKV